MPADDAPVSLPVRFREVRPLGSGSFGRVWAAELDGVAVAVKVLAPALADQPEVAWRFAQEWRTLARLTHPAFPRAIEEGRTDGGAPYYAMELVAGEPPAVRADAGAVRTVLAGLADALAYMHELGLVHGDVKRENVVLAPDGRVRVLDVGLVAPAGQRREAIAGTLEYMAPEVLRKAPVAPASDLYALGVLGWELWAGRPPFDFDPPAPAELVRAHLSQSPGQPPRASEDPALAALLVDLLAKDPAARPSSAREVAARLAGEAPGAGGPSVGLGAGSFVGRDDVLAAWRETLATPGGRLVLQAGAGLGKSRTLDELRIEAMLAGRTWVGARGGGGGDAPGATLRAVVAQALAAAGHVPGPDMAAWLAGRVPPGLAELEPAGRKVAIAALAAEALAGAATALGGLAVGLDDWHRADEASRELAGQLARAAGSAPIAWAVALDERPAGPEAPQAEAAGGLGEGATATVLGPLDEPSTRALLAARLGTDPPAELLARLGPVAAGRPALLDMLLEHLVATGTLAREGEGWRLAAEGAAGVLPVSLEAAWRARLAGLDRAARRLAATSAIAAPAGALPAPLLAEAAGLAPAEAAAALDRLLAEGLALVEGGRVRLALPGMAQAFEGELPRQEAVAAVTTLARRLASAAAEPEALDPATLAAAAALAAEGQDDALAARLCAAAGRAALALGAASDALRWLDQAEARLACAEAIDGVAWLAVELSRAEALRLLDRLDEATAAYEAALARAEALADAHGEAQAALGVAKVRQMRGDYAGALEGFARAERVGAPAQQARAAAGEARVRAFRGEPALALEAAMRAEARARELGAEAVLAQALVMRGYLEASADPTRVPEARGRLEEALAIGERLGDRAGVALALDNLGNVLLAAGDLAGAASVFGRSVAWCKASGLATEALAASLNRAIVAAERGDVGDAISLAADVARRAEALGRRFVQAAAMTAEGQARARRGEAAEARALLDGALAIAERIGNKLLEEHVRAYMLEALLLEARVSGITSALDEAAAQAERLTALVAETGHAETAARLAVLQAELLRLAGDLDGAIAVAAPLADAPNRVAAHGARRVLAETALARGDADTAAAQAGDALAIAEAWGAAWHEAADMVLLARARLAGGPAEPGHAAGAEGSPGEQAAMLARWAHERAGEANPAARRAAEALLRECGATPPRPYEPGSAPVLDLAAYAAWTAALAGAGDEHAVARLALDAAMSLTGADRGYMLAYQEGRLHKAVARGLDLTSEIADGFSRSMVQRAMFTGEPLYVADARSDTDWRGAASVMALELRTVICLPLATPDELLGVLYMDRQAVDPLLGPADMHLLAALASSASAALIRERARGDATTGWELLATLVRRLGPAIAPGAAAEAVLDAAIEAVDAERGYWLVRDDAGWRAELARGKGGAAIAFEPQTISQGVADHVATSGEPLTLLNASEDEAWQARASVQALGLRTVWCVPAGTPDGALLYLDSGELAVVDPAATLRGVTALLRWAAPVLEG